MQAGKDYNVVIRITGCPPEIGTALWILEEARKRTFEQLGDAPDAMMDWVSEHERHAVGTLLYHIALIEADWLFTEVLETDYAPDIIALFPVAARDSSGRLSAFKGETFAEHKQRLAMVRSRVMDVFYNMDLDDFRRTRSLEPYDVTPEWVLFHLSQHEAEHRSEINSLRQRFELENIETE